MKRNYFLASTLIMLMSCGTESTRTPIDPGPSQPPPGDPGKPGNPGSPGSDNWAKAQPIIGKNCGGCHSGDAFIKSLAGWKSSQAKAKLINGSMPPPGSGPARSMTADEKNIMTSL